MKYSINRSFGIVRLQDKWLASTHSHYFPEATDQVANSISTELEEIWHS